MSKSKKEPRCPYCGSEMYPNETLGVQRFYNCLKCGACSPHLSSLEAAYGAAFNYAVVDRCIKENEQMNDNFKEQLAKFARDVKAICEDYHCWACPLRDGITGRCMGSLSILDFDPDAVYTAVAAYNNRNKPSADTIDKAVEYERERERFVCWCSQRECADCDAICRMPHADVRPVVRGEWEEYDDWNDSNIYRCSNCGDAFVLEAGTPKENDYNFCPNCGADMRERSKEQMNDNFKDQLAEFAGDVKAICKEQLCCEGCPLGTGDTKPCAANYNNFDADKAIAAVEAYRRRKKPCAEVIDRALDVYTLEIEIERDAVGATMPAKDFAEGAAIKLGSYYAILGRPATVRVLSAKRFVLESHREEE